MTTRQRGSAGRERKARLRSFLSTFFIAAVMASILLWARCTKATESPARNTMICYVKANCLCFTDNGGLGRDPESFPDYNSANTVFRFNEWRDRTFSSLIKMSVKKQETGLRPEMVKNVTFELFHSPTGARRIYERGRHCP